MTDAAATTPHSSIGEYSQSPTRSRAVPSVDGSQSRYTAARGFT